MVNTMELLKIIFFTITEVTIMLILITSLTPILKELNQESLIPIFWLFGIGIVIVGFIAFFKAMLD